MTPTIRPKIVQYFGTDGGIPNWPNGVENFKKYRETTKDWANPEPARLAVSNEYVRELGAFYVLIGINEFWKLCLWWESAWELSNP